MMGNGNFDGSIKKQVTNFTIDCILSKTSEVSEVRERTLHQQPVTLNKVLNNNPWIPNSPLAHFFTPSAVQKKVPLSPEVFSYYPSSTGSNFITNFIGVNQHNHFYTLSSSSSFLSDNHKNPSHIYTKDSEKFATFSNSKFNSVYEKSICDTQIIINEDIKQQHNNHNNKSSSTIVNGYDGEHKCAICFKTFETSELLEVNI